MSNVAHAQQPDAAFPQGPDAVPLLQEIWEFGAENIYPRKLAKRFDPGTLTQLEEALRSGEPLADTLNPFFDSLGVSHTRFYDRRHQSYYVLRSMFSTRDLDAPRLYTIGAQMDDRDSGRVAAVLDGSPAAAAGIQRGDRIVSVDGHRFDSLLQWQQDAPVRLQIAGHDGRRDVEVTPLLKGFHRSLADATAASRRIIECGGSRIGYLHLWSGTNDVFLATLKETVAEAREAELDGFILDLRDGYGGAWWPYLDSFFADRSRYFSFESFDSTGGSGVVRAEARDNPLAWEGPLAVIANGGTRSGKESLAFQFKRSNRTKLFGTTTAGAFSAGLGAFADRDDGYMLYLAVAEPRLDGVVIEGVGVAPDIVVPEEPGRDAPMDAALTHLQCNSG